MKKKRRRKPLRIKSVRYKDRPSFLDPDLNELDWIDEIIPGAEIREPAKDVPFSRSSDRSGGTVQYSGLISTSGGPDEGTLRFRQLPFDWAIRVPDSDRIRYPLNAGSGIVQENAIETGTGGMILREPDGMKSSHETTRQISDGELGLYGQVYHTNLWEDKRLHWNKDRRSHQRPYDMFWAGESFVLSATVMETETDTYPLNVTAELLGYGNSWRLASLDLVQWNGEMWEGSYDKLSDGDYVVRFTATWNNGFVSTDDVPIKIKGSIYNFLPFS